MRSMLALTGLLTAGCLSQDYTWVDPPDDDPSVELRVYHSPYRDVDWANDRRLLAQFHDHTKDSPWLLDPYDDAGYQVVPLFQYSGIPSEPVAWTELHWPPQDFLPPGYIETLDSIERFYPNVEVTPEWHLTSPFMESYIELWDPAWDPVRLDYHFETGQEAIDMINDRGGYAVLAHPWANASQFVDYTGLHAMEVYSAFALMNHVDGTTDVDPPKLLISTWDALLDRDPHIYGLGVNDWHGPQCVMPQCIEFPEVRDSGKVELVAPSSGVDDVERAFATGAMFAVKDVGLPKRQYPHITSILVAPHSIEIETTGDVVWFTGGQQVADGQRIDLEVLPSSTRYVRAEVGQADGSRVWVQPFVLAVVGDIDGDWDVDAADDAACESGQHSDPDRVAAALAADCN